jgi:hypothetical protein
VSNPVPVNKKQGMIRVCMEFHDLNKAFPKDNFPTPFIDQIVDECAGCEVFSFMDGFSGYNQIQIKPEDQHKTVSYVLGVHSHTGKCLLALKMLEPLFSGPCHSPSMTSSI